MARATTARAARADTADGMSGQAAPTATGPSSVDGPAALLFFRAARRFDPSFISELRLTVPVVLRALLSADLGPLAAATDEPGPIINEPLDQTGQLASCSHAQ